jgi:hypothetical protein
MRNDVTASSRHEHLVLYDPAAIPLDTPVDADLDAQDPVPVPASAMEHLADRGHAVILRIAHADCQATLRLLVGEAPESHLVERGVLAIDGAMLRVPGGRLTIDGIEFLCRAGEARMHSEAVSQEIPAGVYNVQVYNLMPWKSRHRAAAVERNTTHAGRVIGKLVAGYTWLGILLFPVTILIAPAVALIVCLVSSWQPALWVVGIVLLADILALAGFWALSLLSRPFPVLAQATAAQQAFDAENPDVVVCLRHLPEEPTSTVRAMAVLDLA